MKWSLIRKESHTKESGNNPYVEQILGAHMGRTTPEGPLRTTPERPKTPRRTQDPQEDPGTSGGPRILRRTQDSQEHPGPPGGPRIPRRTQDSQEDPGSPEGAPLSSFCDTEGGRGDVLGQPGQHVLGREEIDSSWTGFIYQNKLELIM